MRDNMEVNFSAYNSGSNMGSTNQSQQLMKTDYISQLPIDVARIIFSLAKTNLPALACVSKKWKELAYDEQLYKMIVPAQRFGEGAWKKYIGDPGKEILLPLCVFKDIENGEGWLTLVPEKVKMTNKDGTINEVEIDPEIMETIVENPKEGHKTGYHQDAWRRAIEEKIKPEKMHWVWIRKVPIGSGENFTEQQRLAREQSTGKNETKGADVSGFLDTIVTVFMEKIRSGESCLAIGPVNDIYTWIRVKDQTKDGIRKALGFSAAGLVVGHFYDKAFVGVAVVVARKSFGR